MKKIISVTKRGLPAVWECGGGMTSGGSATIIAQSDGGKPHAIYIRRGGDLSCGQHALVPVHEDYIIVTVRLKRDVRESATIEKILSVVVREIGQEEWEATADVEIINTFSLGEWEKDLPQGLVPAVEAAFSKAGDYHCRSPYYVAE